MHATGPGCASSTRSHSEAVPHVQAQQRNVRSPKHELNGLQGIESGAEFASARQSIEDDGTGDQDEHRIGPNDAHPFCFPRDDLGLGLPRHPRSGAARDDCREREERNDEQDRMFDPRDCIVRTEDLRRDARPEERQGEKECNAPRHTVTETHLNPQRRFHSLLYIAGYLIYVKRGLPSLLRVPDTEGWRSAGNVARSTPLVREGHRLRSSIPSLLRGKKRWTRVVPRRATRTANACRRRSAPNTGLDRDARSSRTQPPRRCPGY